jgi:hypothetical protein
VICSCLPGVTICTYRLCIRRRTAEDGDTRRSASYRRVCNQAAPIEIRRQEVRLVRSIALWVRPLPCGG